MPEIPPHLAKPDAAAAALGEVLRSPGASAGDVEARARELRETLQTAAPAELENRAARAGTLEDARRRAVEAGQLAPLADWLREFEAPEPLALEPLAGYLGAPIPAPILWRDDGSDGDGGPVDAVLSAGEAALLSGEGGAGKSTLALHLAAVGAPTRPVCGLRRAAGPVVLISYEDAPARLADRLTWIPGGEAAPVHVWPDPAPLWEADPDRAGASRPASCWKPLWAAVRRIGARLVVVDPAGAALAGVDASQTGPVRAFFRELVHEAEASAAGVLVIAHPTKAARDEARAGRGPGAGAVAGSAAWVDAARGVLTLERGAGGARLLVCEKANYGAPGWAVELRERFEGSEYRGLMDTGRRIHRDGVAEWRRQQTRQTETGDEDRGENLDAFG